MTYSLDELYATEARLTALLDSGVRDRLLALPDVEHVAVGLREVAGVAVDEFVVKVYVRRKLPAGQLGPERLVPAVVEGVGTDVCVVRTAGPLTGPVPVDDPTQPVPVVQGTPLLGGTVITNGRVEQPKQGEADSLAPGTLGMVATRLSDRLPVVLTNRHVVVAAGGKEKEGPLFQPMPDGTDYAPGSTYPKAPTNARKRVATVVDSTRTELVDAAIATVDTSNCWCCNCGTKYTRLIRLLNDDKSPGPITDVALPVMGMRVYKIGAMDRRRAEGRVVCANERILWHDPGDPVAWIYVQQMTIQGYEPGLPDTPRLFAQPGDSGSVIVDQDSRMVVGLLFGGQVPADPHAPPPPTSLTYANRMTAVMDALGIGFTLSPDSDASEPVVTPAAATTEPPTDLLSPLRDRLARSEPGRRLLDRITTHAWEAVRLANHDRRVTVAWHRAQGPSWLAAFLRSARDPGYRIPDEIAGVTRREAVDALRATLAERGGDALRADLADLDDTLVAALVTSESTDRLLDAVTPGGEG